MRKDILVSLRELNDHFVSEGVLVPDSCQSIDHCSIKEGDIRMAVDYREVNQFFKVSGNQFIPYHNMLFQQLSRQ